MINYAVSTAVVQHVGLAQQELLPEPEPVTGRWEIIPWDLDHTCGNGCCGVNSTFVTPAEPGDRPAS